jgi:hypothetical protein
VHEGPYISEQHAVSRRWAILEDDGRVGWLYLTAPDSVKPISDCWLYNRVPAPERCDIDAMQEGDAPIVPHFAAAPDASMSPSEDSLRLRWSADGESVAAFASGELLGFIPAGYQRGFSRHLRASGAFGSVLDTGMFATLFGGTEA